MTNPKGLRNFVQVQNEGRKKQKTYLKQREFSQINVKHKTIDTGISEKQAEQMQKIICSHIIFKLKKNQKIKKS